MKLNPEQYSSLNGIGTHDICDNGEVFHQLSYQANCELVTLRVRNIPLDAIWRENMLGYLSADIICPEKQTVFRERSSRKTVSYEEQIMPKDKYPTIFSPQMEAFVFITLQIFFATRAILKLGNI